MAFQVPQGYVSGYGDALRRREQQYTQMAQAIGSSIRTPQEVFRSDITDSIKEALGPLTSAFTSDVGSWDNIDFSKIDNAGKAWLKFKNQMETNGGRGHRWAERQGLMDPLAFKKAYDERLGATLTTIEDKLKVYQATNRISDKNMRKWISENPNLQNMLASSTDAHIADLATPRRFEGVLGGLWGASGDIATAGSPLLLGGGLRAAQSGFQAYRAGTPVSPALGKGFRRGVTPFSSIGSRIKGGAIGQEKKLLQTLKPTAGKMLQTTASKRAESALKTAQSKYNTAAKEYKKNYKGKSKNPNFGTSKSGIAMKNKIETAKSSLAKTYKPDFRTKKGLKVITNFIKQKGARGLYSAAVKTLGRRAASMLMVRLAASGIMKAGGVFTGGVTTALSTLLDGYALFQLGKVITRTIAEESGGIRNPGEMLFGPRQTGKMPGQ
jgi:hypothetical protein